MSVYQVEEYYVYVSLTAEQKLAHSDDIQAFIDDYGFESYEISDDGVTIDGFDTESAAEEISEEIESIISK